jgi:HAMP domain-containing protein
MKLFWKIFIAVITPFFIVISGISYITSANSISHAKEGIIKENRIISSFIAKQIKVSAVELKWPFETLEELSKREDFLFWWMAKEDGEIYLADKTDFIGTHVHDYFPQITPNTENMTLFLDDMQNYGILIHPLKIKGKRCFLLGFSTMQIQDFRKEVILFTSLLGSMALIILTAMLFFTIKRITNPITRLKRAATEMAEGKLDKSIKAMTSDEIGDLAKSFEKMRHEVHHSQLNLEKEVRKRTKELMKSKKELDDQVHQMEKFNRMAVGRELRMIELKKRIKELEGKK